MESSHHWKKSLVTGEKQQYVMHHNHHRASWYQNTEGEIRLRWLEDVEADLKALIYYRQFKPWIERRLEQPGRSKKVYGAKVF